MAQINTAEIHVLSLDGGGSRGIMESIMLGHIMDLSTLMTKKPGKITQILRNFQLDAPEVGQKFQSLIELEKLSPIHPTEAFQYIVGTSTGSLIAFGLVGGKKDQTTGKRIPLSVKEVTELYQEVIPTIFKKAKNGKGWLDWFLERAGKVERLKGTPITPYTQKFLKLAVDEKFGTALTEDIGYNGCLAGAVARQFNEDPINRPDVLEIFDSKSDPPQLVSEVLLGSSDAPIYFEVPSKIGFRNYIDGGVAGNCPLGEALPQLKKLYPQAQVRSILSLAPPAHKPDSKKLEELETQWEKTKKMGSYLLAQITDGEAVFKTTKDNHPDIQFLRVRPTLDKSAEFPMDEERVDKMMVAMEDELIGNPKYLQKIIDSATIIALRIIKDFSEEHLDMFEELLFSMKNRRQYKEAIHTAETLLRLIPQTGQNIDFQIYLQQTIGDCQRELEQFEASIVSYEKALELTNSTSGEEISKNIDKATIMHNMAMSYEYLNNLEEAIKWYKQSLELKKERPDSPAKHYVIATTLNSIGECYRRLSEYQKALDEWYETARKQLEGAKDDQDTKELKSMLYNNEGICHDALGHYDKALEAYEKAQAINKETNASAEDLAKTLNNIAAVLSSAQGSHEEALKKHKESLEKLRDHSGQDAKTVGIAMSLNNIGVGYLFLKDYPEGGKWLREALAMKKIVHCGNHPDTARTLTALGLSYRYQGDLNKAKDFHKQAYDMIMACEGHDDQKASHKRNLDKIEKKLLKK